MSDPNLHRVMQEALEPFMGSSRDHAPEPVIGAPSAPTREIAEGSWVLSLSYHSGGGTIGLVAKVSPATLGVRECWGAGSEPAHHVSRWYLERATAVFETRDEAHDALRRYQVAYHAATPTVDAAQRALSEAQDARRAAARKALGQ